MLKLDKDKKENQSNESALSPAGPTALAPRPANPEGFENTDRTDFEIPRLRIVQPSSQEGEVGTFFLTVGEETHEPPLKNVVMLSYKKTRSDWRQGEDQWRCHSRDCIRPDDEVSAPPAKECAKCPMALWVDGKSPACAQRCSCLVAFGPDRTAAVISLSKMNIKPTRGFLTYARKLGYNLFDYQFDWELIKVDNTHGAGKFYVVKYTNFRLHNDPAYAQMRAEMIQAAERAVEDEERVVSQAADRAVEGEDPAPF